MELHTIHLKGMVCNRCLMTVENELMEMGHTPVQVSLGEISFISNDENDPSVLMEKLVLLGFSLLEDKKLKMTKEIKKLVEEVYSGHFDFPEQFRFSALAKLRLGKDYEGISDAFIATEKKTIEKYIIEYRINKIKEFLTYSNQTLAEIAFRLNFTSVAHLSSQFRQQTGLTPSYFKEIKRNKTGARFPTINEAPRQMEEL